jgi:hypothetical protein
MRSTTLLAFMLLQGIIRVALGICPRLLEVFTTSRLFCDFEYHFHITVEMIPLMEFLPFDAHSLFKPAEYRGYCFP